MPLQQQPIFPKSLPFSGGALGLVAHLDVLWMNPVETNCGDLVEVPCSQMQKSLNLTKVFVAGHFPDEAARVTRLGLRQ